MADIAALLKSEIIRLSRKVVREHINPLKTASTAQRRQLADLRNEVSALRKEVARLTRAARSNPAQAGVSEDKANFRFVAKGFRTHRARLGLSAEDTATILGVSGQTIFNWEKGNTKPRPDQLPAIAALRKMGKREVAGRLVEIATPGKTRKA